MNKLIQNSLISLFLENRVFSTSKAASILNLTTKKTSEILVQYTKRGDIKRVKKGYYIPVPERFLTPDESVSDSLKLIPSLFPKCYIGGWSAANFWQLTDQIFESTSLLMVGNVSHKIVNKNNFRYAIFTTHDHFGCEIIFKENEEILISNPHRTILDMIENPSCGAGIQHVMDCFQTYIHEHLDEKIIEVYATKYKKGAFFKRLGFLFEKFFGSSHPLCTLSRERITKGYTKIDNRLECPKLITRWNLFINESIFK